MRLGIYRLRDSFLLGPFASSALGAALYTLALTMLEDVQGWSRLVRTKAPETG
ncbi:MAG: hypothetical protein ACREFO_05000 [Acetobacteraceae bacterium]